jgi:DNA-binding NarL/FixJ family response regulator
MATYQQRVKARAHKGSRRTSGLDVTARQAGNWNAACRRADREELSDYRLLTPRQIQVLELVGRGLTNRQIASELGVTEGTVELHVTAVNHRLAA